MAELERGLKGTFEFKVEERFSTGHVGVQVLSTPGMIAMMELASMKLVQPYLDEGSTTVGTKVCIDHKAPAPLGATVTVVTELVNVEGRRLEFEVSAYWGDRLLGEGRHERYVVNKDRFVAKLKEELY
ncbi:MAG: thioesterase family protein [Candidatus Korarchaeum sp.]|nr:thioesterase family protein [Candidatus Korarchaeum sp.]MDW8036272.1 thioesterase family protein [Candidatus Korarchaeum sp.]